MVVYTLGCTSGWVGVHIPQGGYTSGWCICLPTYRYMLPYVPPMYHPGMYTLCTPYVHPGYTMVAAVHTLVYTAVMLGVRQPVKRPWAQFLR